MVKCNLKNSILENKIAGDVLSAFFSIAPRISMLSLVAFITAIAAFHFFFNPLVFMDLVGGWILAASLVIGLITLFKSVHLAVEEKLFRVLYQNPDKPEIFDAAVQFLWRSHTKGLTLQERWEGSYKNFMTTIILCILQWLLTVIGFAILVIFVQPL